MEQTLFSTQTAPLRLYSRNLGDAYASVLEEPSLFYQPPYRTMLEDELAWHFTKYLHDEAAFQDSAKIRTPYAEFDVDFLVELGKQRIGFMCGLMDSENELAQSGFKDALLIDAGGLDVLYRFRKEDLEHRLHDCLQLVAAWNPGLFSQRGLVNLDILSCEGAKAFKASYNTSLFIIQPEQSPIEDALDGEAFYWPDPLPELVFRRMCRHYPAAWLYEYERALKHYGVSEDVLRQKWSRSA